jgi:hypothetical protein
VLYVFSTLRRYFLFTAEREGIGGKMTVKTSVLHKPLFLMALLLFVQRPPPPENTAYQRRSSRP